MATSQPDLEKVQMMIDMLDGGFSANTLLGMYPDRPGWWQAHWECASDPSKTLSVEGISLRIGPRYLKFVMACLCEVGGGLTEWK